MVKSGEKEYGFEITGTGDGKAEVLQRYTIGGSSKVHHCFEPELLPVEMDTLRREHTAEPETITRVGNMEALYLETEDVTQQRSRIMEKMKNVMVMGGSFNPPTIAHLKLIQAAVDAMNAEAGYLVPVSHAYLKRKMVQAGCGHLCIASDTRLRMLESMISNDTRLHVYTGEINEPIAVTLRTMEQIQLTHPDARVWFVAGADKLGLLNTLARKRAFLPRFGAVVFSRGDNLDQQIAENAALSSCREAIAVIEPPTGIEGISSTAVRKHLFDPDAVADMLHPAVLPMVRQLKAEDFPEEIIAFKGENSCLSNDYSASVAYHNTVYLNAEAAFQASKTDDPALRAWFAAVGPDKAKQKGNQIKPQPVWEEAKDSVMREIVRQKFMSHPDLREKLMATENLRLINGGKGKKDTYWGVNTFTWEGENRLGVILMELRSQWREERYI